MLNLVIFQSIELDLKYLRLRMISNYKSSMSDIRIMNVIVIIREIFETTIFVIGINSGLN
jgi:hypothetical protein